MKKNLFLLVIFFAASALINAQTYNSDYLPFYNYQQPDARSEAMGKAQVNLHGNPLSSTYNAASGSFSEGINAEFTQLNPKYNIKPNDSRYNTYGLSYNTKKYGAFAFDVQRFSYGEFSKYGPSSPVPEKKYTAAMTNYMLNYSNMIYENLSIGINANYVYDNFEDLGNSAWLFDIGTMKKFTLNSETNIQNIFISASCSNITNTELKMQETYVSAEELINKKYFPSDFRIGVSYEYENKLQLSGFRILKVLVSAEYNDLLNSKFYTSQKAGAEVSFLEMLQLRLGYYHEYINDNTDEGNKENLSELTYGLGIYLPLRKIFNVQIPLSLQFDYASLPAPSYNERMEIKDNYPVFNLKLNLSI